MMYFYAVEFCNSLCSRYVFILLCKIFVQLSWTSYRIQGLEPFLSLPFHRPENPSQKSELHRTRMHAANPDSLFVHFCDRSSKRGSNWRTPASASFCRGSATSVFQCVKTHLCAQQSTHSASARKRELSFDQCTLL